MDAERSFVLRNKPQNSEKAVDHYPEYFTQSNRKAALEKARIRYAAAEEYLNSLSSSENKALVMSSSKWNEPSVRRVQLNARSGRG